MTALPIDSLLPEIVEKVRHSRSLVLVAPPGAGKTTRVPTALLRAGLLGVEHPRLLMLQPRRVAARTVSARIAAENGWTLGDQVGYQVRFERVLRPHTPLRVITEGILTRQLLDDPFLTGVGAVLLDEFHERSLHSDLAVALLREVQQTVRPDLILLIMSATLEAEPAAEFLGNCPIVRATGRAFPVEIAYQPGGANDSLPALVAGAVHQIIGKPFEQTGDVLAFLPGAEEIRRAEQLLRPAADRHNLQVFPLYGSLPAEQQNLALRPAPGRKIILATNIAETSLTIDGVRTVVDAGFARVASYDAARGIDRLDLQRISKASATQRAGRAGRTAPGTCVRLWSEKQHRALPDFDLPEIRRVDLCATVLSLHAWGIPDVRTFGWYEPPADTALLAAETLLVMLGALQGTPPRLTRLGKRLVGFPAHPRLARLLLAADDDGLPREGAALVALMSEKDILPPTPGRREPTLIGESDLLHRLSLLQKAERQRFTSDQEVDSLAARQVARVRDDLLRGMDRPRTTPAAPADGLLKLPLYAYPDRVCKRRHSDPAAGAMVGGGGVRLAGESLVRRSELFLALDLRHDPRSPSREAIVRVASAVHPDWLAELFPQSVRQEDLLEFDPARQRVVGVRRRWYLDLLLDEQPHGTVDPLAAGEILAAALRPRARELFQNNPAAADLIARLALLGRAIPEQPWPTLGEDDLARLLHDACHGRRALDELPRHALADAIRSQLPYPLDRLLDQYAPTALTVPTGNVLSLQYSPDGAPPILAVRLQEMFGLPATPRIAAGRVPVKLHLLGPNYRPVQVTDDLANFWASTYFQVRKDLRARYPKHAWPDNPLAAPPQAKGRPTAAKPR